MNESEVFRQVRVPTRSSDTGWTSVQDGRAAARGSWLARHCKQASESLDGCQLPHKKPYSRRRTTVIKLD
jgi:hypothetical protein